MWAVFRRSETKDPGLLIIINSEAEAGVVTAKSNGVTHYRLCHVFKAITFRSDNGPNFDRAITSEYDNVFNELEAISSQKNSKKLEK